MGKDVSLSALLSHGVPAPERWMVRKILASIGNVPFEFMLGRNLRVSPGDTTPMGKLKFQNWRALFALMLDPELGFGEGYMAGKIDVDGDLVQMLEAVYRGMAKANRPSYYGELVSKWMELWQNNSLRGSRHNIHAHYDLGNDFYKLWLDEQMVYTCAYFPTPNASLEEAQTAKMDHICRKLRLQRGETVAEAGCGWGAMALHMARHYGVNVTAFNISREQISYARRRAAAEGLTDRVDFIEDDYRNISGRFDVFLSVGMLEHVGKRHYPEFSSVVRRAIGDSGRGLLHFIGRNSPAPFSRWIRKRVFPGAYAPSLREALTILEQDDYSPLDVENLRLHYAKTIEHWLHRFEQSSEEIASMYDDAFVRAWRLYLAGSQVGFLTGTLQLFQVVFAGQACRWMPWTRADLYNPVLRKGQAGREEGTQTQERTQSWMPATS